MPSAPSASRKFLLCCEYNKNPRAAFMCLCLPSSASAALAAFAQKRSKRLHTLTLHRCSYHVYINLGNHTQLHLTAGHT